MHSNALAVFYYLRCVLRMAGKQICCTAPSLVNLGFGQVSESMDAMDKHSHF